MGGLTRKIEALSPEQLQALADRLLATRPKGGDEDRESKRPAQIPLSFAQEGLWLLDQLGLARSAYNECFAVRLTGTLNDAVLERSIGDVVRRHEALRTRIALIGDQPCQVVEPPGEVRLRSLNLSEHSPQERELQARRQLEAAASELFDLEKGPLYRASLIKLSDREHILCWVVHHMIWDGWSTWLFLGEVTARYAAHIEGKPFLLPAIRLQYADYALRQRRRAPMGGAELLKYWRKQLEGASPTLDLPTDRPRGSVASLKGAERVKVTLDHDLVDGLQRLARQEGVTLYMLGLAAFKVVLSRWSGIADIVVGTPVAGRTGRGTEDLIGFFSNMLVMRTSVSGDVTFRELLQSVRATVVDAFGHQDMPFGTLVSELRPQRLLGRNPLFQVCFALHDFHGEVNPEVTGDLQLSVLEHAEFTPKFELELQLAKERSGMSAWFSYQPAIFDRSTIERWMTHYQSVLSAIVRDPTCRVSRIPMLADGERKRLLEEFQPVAASEPPIELAHELFEEQAHRNPEATALVSGGREWTFGELNREANRLAHCLIERNVGPDVPVGMLSCRVTDAVVGLLAVLKAGGAYLPLGPDDSPEALRDVVDRAAPRAILVSGYSKCSLPSSGDAAVIRLDSDSGMLGEMPDVDPGRRGLAGHHLAYVTSPVTFSGERKQVMIEHRGVANLVQWTRTHFPSDRFPQVAFSVRPDLDWSVVDLLAWLASGVTVHALVPPLSANESIPDVSVLCSTPSALERLVDERRLGDELRAVLVRGGRLSRRLVDKLLSTTSLKRVTYLFGYPETTTYSIYRHISEPAGAERRIGRPVTNTRVYVLDAERQPVPIGTYGAICIGGVGVGRGYLHDSEATAHRFVPDPFDTQRAGRMFLTGRNGRWLDDGSLELEDPLEKPTDRPIAELQKELDRWENVLEAAVVANDDGDVRLRAYVALDRAQAATRRELRRAQWEGEHVAAWSERGKEIYGSGYGVPVEPGFDVAGWVSSYTGLPFNPAELRETVDETISRIKSLAPQRVLDVGCGTGLLLHGVAPGCESYIATDLSSDALQRLQLQLTEFPPGCDVELYALAADQIGQLAVDPRDVVILDSVVHCFPSAEYLLEVIRQAVDCVTPAGNIFVGGVRHLSLRKAFHASVQLHRAADSMSIAEFRARVLERMTQERELALSPELFVQFGRRNKRIGEVQIHLKRGCYDNELNNFQYDVVLRVGDKLPSARPIWLDGRDSGLATKIVKLIKADRPRRVVVRRIPNARLTKYLALQRLLETPPAKLESVGELRRLVDADTGQGLEPELLWSMGEQLQYDVHLDWSAAREDGSFDAVFTRFDTA